MAVAVVTTAAGGLPVIDVTATKPALGLPVTEAASGIAVTKVSLAVGGLPVTFVVVEATGGGSVAPPLDGLAGVTGAWSASRKMLTSYSANSGAFYRLASGFVDLWYDQNGIRNFSQTTAAMRPSIVAVGTNSRDMLNFDGVDDTMVNGNTNTFIAAADGYVIAAFFADDTSSNNVAIQANDAIFADDFSGMGVYIKAGNLQGLNWDGGNDVTTAEPVSISTMYIIEWWHTGGVLSTRLSSAALGTARTVASGNTSGTTQLSIGKSGSALYDGKLAEMATFNVVPSGAERDALVTNLKTYYGAA